MYKRFIRPVLFLFSPEKIHECLVAFVKCIHRIPFVSGILKKCYTINSPIIEKEFLGMKFQNPVGLAAGFDKNASFYREFSSFGFGFIEVGTITPKPQPGNPKPRSFRLPADKALINRMGINNLGVEHAVEMLRVRPKNFIIGGNIGKNTLTPNEKAVDDYCYCFEKLYDFVDYFVINLSCPNIGDIDSLQDTELLTVILGQLASLRAQKQEKKPILLKISPDLNFKQIDDTINIIEKLGIDGIVCANTTKTRNKLVTDEKIVKSIGNGGMSGAPLRDRSTEMIRYIKSKTNGKMPMIGVGGIMSVEDALEKIEAGAELIQVYTGFIYEGPGFVRRINRELVKKGETNPKKISI